MIDPIRALRLASEIRDAVWREITATLVLERTIEGHQAGSQLRLMACLTIYKTKEEQFRSQMFKH